MTVRPEIPGDLPRRLLVLASSQNLGRLVAVVRPARNTGLTVVAVSLSLVPVFFLFGPAAAGGVILGVIVWPLSAALLLRGPLLKKQRVKRIYLYEEGFVYAANDESMEPYRWDRIATVFQSIVKSSYNGISTGTQYLYTVTRDDGTTIKLTRFWDDIAMLGPHVNASVCQAMLPRFQAALREGRSVQFGDIVVNAGGVATRRATVPWGEITGLRIVNGQVSLMRGGKRLPLSSTAAAKIPNLPLFLHVVDAYRGQAARAR